MLVPPVSTNGSTPRVLHPTQGGQNPKPTPVVLRLRPPVVGRLSLPVLDVAAVALAQAPVQLPELHRVERHHVADGSSFGHGREKVWAPRGRVGSGLGVSILEVGGESGESEMKLGKGWKNEP